MPGGKNTNKSGLKFEDEIKELFFNKEMENGDDYMIGDKKFKFYMKRALHKHLVKNDMYNFDDWNHCKEADFALLDENNDNLFLFEVKFQAYSGSCDNKIRGANSLRREYKEDLYPKLKNVHLYYLGNTGRETPDTSPYGFGIKKLKIPIKHNEDDGIPFFFAEKADNRYRRFKIKRKGKEVHWLPIPYQYKIDVDAIEKWMLSKLQSSTHLDSLSV